MSVWKDKTEAKIRLFNLAVMAGIVALLVMEWMGHRRIGFMMDDLWYATNLKSGETLRGLPDVIESQIWHFMNWGGRCVTHGILQITLMAGEFSADIINLMAMLFLVWMICVFAGWKKPFCFLCASSMIVAMNANARMSMFWQAGAVNYVYATAWILLFLWPYIRQTEKPDSRPMPLINLWIIPLGLMAGWSNENMGPASFVITLAVSFGFARRKKLQGRLWMLSGSAMCLAGSILVVVAPGNFVRMSFIEKKSFGEAFYERFCSMLYAGTDYLFPSVAFLATVLLFWLVCLGGKLRESQWLLAALAFLSYGAMALSPHYPDRATFGTMVVCIILSLSVLKDIVDKKKELYRYVGWTMFPYWCYALLVLYRLVE